MYRNKNNRGGGGGRQNAKQISMNRFKEIDADLGSRFDDLYEEEEEESRNTAGARYLNRNQPRPVGRNGAGSYEQKKNVQLVKGAAGSAVKEFVSKIRVSNGHKYGQRFILKALIGHVEELKPIMPKMTDNGDFEFFVRDNDVAQGIRMCSRRIRHAPSGDRLNISVSNTVAPWAKLKKEEKDAIAEVVENRADTQNRALELSGFATHDAFTSRDLMMNMTKNNVFLAVVELIEAKYSDIIALSLKNNRIKYLEMAAMLPYFAKNLKVLDLSDNQIESVEELEKLKGLRLTTLFLENNPVCENYSKASDYLSAVQAIFPRITILDGNQCSALPGAFDDDKEFVEPPARPGFYGDAALRTIVETFIIEYFKSYDGDEPTASRKNLIAAYDDTNSQFTMAFQTLYEEGAGSARWPNNDNFSFHIRLSHNIKQQEKWGRREHRASRLFHGALDVAAQLCKMPATRHLQESFIVDVVLATSSLLIFSVQGLFEEAPFAVSPNLPQLNFFSRTFTVTPKENGSVCVISDELFLSAMNMQRVERYRVQLGKANAAPPAVLPATATAAVAAPVGEPTEAIKQEMVAAFCRDSGMKTEWSHKCLMEANWNYEVAGAYFLANKGGIPAEAFTVPPVM